MKQPLLSIVTVCKNDLENLQKTLASIAKQSFRDYEVIVVDGASEDGTIEWMKSQNNSMVSFSSEPDSGIYDAMNKGIEKARGLYLNFLNAGDLYFDDSVLASVSSKLNNETDLFYGDSRVNENGKDNSSWYQKALDFTEKNLLDVGTAVVCHQAVFIRKEISPKYDLKYKYKAELNWYFDILEQNNRLRWIHINEPLVIYFTGGFGYVNFNANLKESLKVIKDRYGTLKLFRFKTLLMIMGKLSYRYSFIRNLKSIIVANKTSNSL